MQKYLNEIILLFLNLHGRQKFIAVIYWVQELLTVQYFVTASKKREQAKILVNFQISRC